MLYRYFGLFFVFIEICKSFLVILHYFIFVLAYKVDDLEDK